jgi:hypothetical protein
LLIVGGSALKAPYDGQNAPQLTHAVSIAKGGALLLDEAYAIANGEHGKDALDCVVSTTGVPSTEILWIAAGYTAAMELQFFDANEGLRRRFIRVNFHKYSTDDLLRIFGIACSKDQYTVDADAMNLLRKELDQGECRQGEGGAMDNLLKLCADQVPFDKNPLNGRNISEETMIIAIQGFKSAYPKKAPKYLEPSDDGYDPINRPMKPHDKFLTDDDIGLKYLKVILGFLINVFVVCLLILFNFAGCASQGMS